LDKRFVLQPEERIFSHEQSVQNVGSTHATQPSDKRSNAADMMLPAAFTEDQPQVARLSARYFAIAAALPTNSSEQLNLINENYHHFTINYSHLL
jgi:hypothetical protein